MERIETEGERLERLRRKWQIEQSPCPACGSVSGQPCWRTIVPHFARRERAIRDGHYQP